MKFFLDTAVVDEIREWNATGLLDGVTTNPSLILKSGRDVKEVLAEICDIVEGPVSGEVVATDYENDFVLLGQSSFVGGKSGCYLCVALHWPLR